MLKWFRKHNKWILVVGMAFLMVAFLVPMSALQLIGQPQDEPIGTLAGQELTIKDRQIASGQLQILGAVSQLLSLPMQVGEDPVLRWMLMLHEAKSMGMSASEGEINEVLESDVAKKIAKDYVTTVEVVRETVRDGITVQRYMYMIDPEWWMKLPLPPQQRFMVQYFYGAKSRNYLTRPLLTRFLNDKFANASISLIEVSSDTYVKKADPPDAAQLQALFDKYKGDFKGLGEPYGFGYKFTDRVKLEYIAIPLDRVAKKIKVRDEEVYDHYQTNKKDFQVPIGLPQRSFNDPPPAMRQQSYTEARGRIINLLSSRKTRALANEIIQVAQNLLSQQARAVPEDQNGYRDVAAAVKQGWKPLPLPELVDTIQKRFGVLVDYSRYDQEWLDREALGNLKGIGAATLPALATNPNFKPPFVITEEGSRAGGFDYVMSARGFEAKDHRLAKHRLQISLPGKSLEGRDGSRYLFRLIDVSKSREPKNLEEVRKQVEINAQGIAAYKLLQAESDKWRKRAVTDDFEKIAKELKVDVLTPFPFGRRASFGPGQIPNVTPIGPDKQFVNGTWDLADQVELAGGVEKASMQQRTGVVAVDRKRNLYLVRIDKLSHMTKRQNDSESHRRGASEFISLMYRDGELPESPFSLPALGKRLGFLDSEGKSLKSPDQDDSSDSSDSSDSPDSEPN